MTKLNTNNKYHFADAFIQSDFVMHAYILCMGGPGIKTHNPDVASAMLYKLGHTGPLDRQQQTAVLPAWLTLTVASPGL
jgi:hypothetical protein